MLTNKPAQTCPCGSEQSYNDCCGKFIYANQEPETAEQLMRSRYTAYTLKNEEYLLNSWHHSTRPNTLNLQNDTDTTQWKKLKVISNTENTVTFVAYFTDTVKDEEHLLFLYEESDFIKDKHWFYLEGKNLKTSKLTKNMPCPCQSGKKFKRCCADKL